MWTCGANNQGSNPNFTLFLHKARRGDDYRIVEPWELVLYILMDEVFHMLS
jgi:hypothetical protein